MIKRIFLLVIIVNTALQVDAQFLHPNYLKRDLKIHTDTSIVDLVIIDEDLNIKAKPYLTYYWYKNRKVFTNQGGIGGFVLDGAYKCYALNNQLIEQGYFQKGLKHGSWDFWDKQGNLLIQKEYKNGLLHGKVICYKNNANGEITKYAKGEPRKDTYFFKGLFFKQEKDSIAVDTVVLIEPIIPIEETNETIEEATTIEPKKEVEPMLQPLPNEKTPDTRTRRRAKQE